MQGKFYSERGYASASADAKGASAIKGGNDDPSVEGNEKVEEEQLRIPLYMEGTEGSHGHKITEWLVKEGDAFESDEPICQVETEEFFMKFLPTTLMEAFSQRYTFSRARQWQMETSWRR